ncbi:hypothetical protein HDK90DRAFT_468856 [Phyllosticta capitalensis]|uniref:Uncharacterized protein n=1 Tax=Phyllosticta capitalensis TaxID=121624 RepID=A0ABR1YHA2_9PEZI
MSSLAENPRRRAGKAPRKVKQYFRHRHDADGFRTVSKWSDHQLPPLYSFQVLSAGNAPSVGMHSHHQVYVTYDLSNATDSELEKLACYLHYRLFSAHGRGVPGPVRFDVHLIGPGATTEDCVTHYRRLKNNPPADPSLQIVPSYVCSGHFGNFVHHSLLFKIVDPGWEKDRVGLVEVDFDTSDREWPDEENATTAGDALMMTVDIYNTQQEPGNIAEDCEAVYEAALAADLTEW